MRTGAWCKRFANHATALALGVMITVALTAMGMTIRINRINRQQPAGTQPPNCTGGVLDTSITEYTLITDKVTTYNVTIPDTIGLGGTVVEEGSLIDPTRYTVFISGGTIYVKNGTTGMIDYSSAAAEVAIQYAIDNLPTTGGTILIRNGDYVLANGLDDGDKDYVTMVGESWAACLKMGNNVQVTILNITSRTGWTVKNLQFDGNKANNVQVAGGVPHDMNQNLIHLYNSTFCTIQNNYCHDSVMHGINVHYQSSDNWILDNRVEDCGEAGDYGAQACILVFNYADRNTVRGNKIKNGHARGIYVSYFSDDVVVDGNIILHDPTAGSVSHNGIICMDNSNRVRITSNVINGTNGSGIELGDAAGPNFQGAECGYNTLIDCGQNLADGIWTSVGGMYCHIHDNLLVWETGAASAQTEGINVLSNNSEIANNKIIFANGGRYGIFASDAATHLIVKGNEIHNSGDKGIYVIGVYNIVNDNKVYDNQANEGIYVDGDDSVCTGNLVYSPAANGITLSSQRGIVSYNSIYDPGWVGVYAFGNEASCNGNQVYSAGSDGLYIVGERTTITGNHVGAAAADGIALSGATNTVIVGNKINDCTGHGIEIRANTVAAIITGCHTHGNVGGSVNLAAATVNNTYVHGNIFEEGAITNVGTNTTAILNYDPSTNGYILAINPPKDSGGDSLP